MLKQIRTRIKITNRLISKTGQDDRNDLEQSRLSPAESPVLLYRIIHLITEGRGYQHTQLLADN